MTSKKEVPFCTCTNYLAGVGRKWKVQSLNSREYDSHSQPEAQLPDTPVKAAILKTVWEHFRNTPRAFEAFSARLFQMHDQRTIIDEITRLLSMEGETLSADIFLASVTTRSMRSFRSKRNVIDHPCLARD